MNFSILFVALLLVVCVYSCSQYSQNCQLCFKSSEECKFVKTKAGLRCVAKLNANLGVKRVYLLRDCDLLTPAASVTEPVVVNEPPTTTMPSRVFDPPPPVVLTTTTTRRPVHGEFQISTSTTTTTTTTTTPAPITTTVPPLTTTETPPPPSSESTTTEPPSIVDQNNAPPQEKEEALDEGSIYAGDLIENGSGVGEMRIPKVLNQTDTPLIHGLVFKNGGVYYNDQQLIFNVRVVSPKFAVRLMRNLCTQVNILDTYTRREQMDKFEQLYYDEIKSRNPMHSFPELCGVLRSMRHSDVPVQVYWTSAAAARRGNKTATLNLLTLIATIYKMYNI